MAILQAKRSVTVAGLYALMWLLFTACAYNWSANLAYSLGSNLTDMVVGGAGALAYAILGVPGKSAAGDAVRPYFWMLALASPLVCFSYVLYKKPRLESLVAAMLLHLTGALMGAVAFAYVLWLPFALVGRYWLG